MKILRRATAFLLSIAALVFGVCAASAEQRAITRPDEAFGFADGNLMTIAPAVLTENGQTRNVYVVGLQGMRGRSSKISGTRALLPMVVLGAPGAFTRYAKEKIFENVPEGSAIVFYGFSVGGMAVQTLRADREIKEKYDVLHTLTGAAPKIMLLSRLGEGTLVRASHKKDAVPRLSLAAFIDPFNNLMAPNIRVSGGGYESSPEAHNNAYFNPELWLDWDALGLSGDATLTYDADSEVYFEEE